MRFSNKAFTFLSLYLYTILPSFAYSSGDAIVITRKAPVKKALLDRKFIFMQERKSSTLNSASSTPKLNDYSSKPVALVKALSPNNTKKAIVERSTAKAQTETDNWDAYVEEIPVELEEKLGVEAKLLNTN